MKTIRKLLFPLIIFAAFIYSLIYLEDLISQATNIDREFLPEIIHKLILIGFFLSAAYLFNKLLKVFFWDPIGSRTLQKKVPRLVIHFVSLIVYLIALAIILGYVFKKPLTGLWATSGVMALVLGFALRNMILDLFTGLAINIERPFQIGDWIQVNKDGSGPDIIGEIIDINWRATRLRNEEGKVFILSNSLLNDHIITNYSYNEKKVRFETYVHLDYEIPIEKAKTIMLSATKQILKENGFFTYPEPSVVAGELNEYGIKYTIRYFIKPWIGINPINARDRVNSSILGYLNFSGITPAYPKEELFYSKSLRSFSDSDTVQKRESLLHKISLFSALDKGEISEIAEKIEGKSYKKEYVLIKKGDSGDSMFLLSEGLLDVKISKDNGELYKVGEIAPGDYFGEMSLLTGEPRSATVICSTDAYVYEIKKQHVEQLFKNRPEILEDISKLIANRRAQTEEALESINKFQANNVDSFTQNLLNNIRKFFA